MKRSRSGRNSEASAQDSRSCLRNSEASAQEELEESVFHKKLKEKGREGRILFLKDWLEYLITNNKTIPPDFPTFVREIMGLDDRAGFIHIRIWHEKSELVEFAINRDYEYKVEHYD
ncbi:MAG: hypothetical protein QME59_05060 [Candidatus Hydrothermarchaeota archaeon]|nr:hypothetical protein [Candidatus Hydrothermarchaeota archaeon]